MSINTEHSKLTSATQSGSASPSSRTGFAGRPIPTPAGGGPGPGPGYHQPDSISLSPLVQHAGPHMFPVNGIGPGAK